jgi:hypothetical protein
MAVNQAKLKARDALTTAAARSSVASVGGPKMGRIYGTFAMTCLFFYFLL